LQNHDTGPEMVAVIWCFERNSSIVIPRWRFGAVDFFVSAIFISVIDDSILNRFSEVPLVWKLDMMSTLEKQFLYEYDVVYWQSSLFHPTVDIFGD